jgi:hypothetical protein
MEEIAAGSSSIADRVLHLHLVGEQQGNASPCDEESEAAGAVAAEVGDAAAAAAVEEEEEEEDEEEEDEEEEEEEEEGEDDPTVLIGFLQKPDKPSSLSRHFFPSKAGGPPVSKLHRVFLVTHSSSFLLAFILVILCCFLSS